MSCHQAVKNTYTLSPAPANSGPEGAAEAEAPPEVAGLLAAGLLDPV